MLILINGAGIAGLTAAYWLRHYGFEVDIVDKHNFSNRSHGFLIDFSGSGYTVCEKMGLTKKLSEKHHALKEFIFLNPEGVRDSSFDITKLWQLSRRPVATIMRSDLETMLLELIQCDTAIHTNRQIKKLTPADNKMLVEFSDETEKQYDIVIGADGIHSPVRNLVFGCEEKFSHYLGFQLVVVVQPRNIPIDNSFYSYSVLGKQVNVYPISPEQMVVLYLYRASEKQILNPINTIQTVFRDAKWVVPQLLSAISASTKIYASDLSQINMPQWHDGRVVLIGDACHCLTLAAAQGASMAMAGAYILSTLLNKQKNNPKKAFSEYQLLMQPVITQKQHNAIAFINAFIPESNTGMLSRHFFARQFFKKIGEQSTIDEYLQQGSARVSKHEK